MLIQLYSRFSLYFILFFFALRFLFCFISVLYIFFNFGILVYNESLTHLCLYTIYFEIHLQKIGFSFFRLNQIIIIVIFSKIILVLFRFQQKERERERDAIIVLRHQIVCVCMSARIIKTWNDDDRNKETTLYTKLDFGTGISSKK